MESKKLLIAGIDPGITTAYAVLDIEGKLVHLNSSKQLDLKLIISQVINFGKVALVGTDKAKVPGMVEAFATKIGADIASPEEDLKVDEKRRMTSGFDFSDVHQGDALASALFAYREIKPLLDKIDAFAKENEKQNIKDRIKELVISRKISIKSAASLLGKKDEEAKIVEKAIAEREFNEHDFLKIYNKLKKYEKEIKLVKIHNNSLKNKIVQLEKSRISAEKPKSGNKLPIDFKEKRIRFLEDLLRSKDRHAEGLRSLVRKYNIVLSNISNFHILKKLDTLGINEFNFKNKILNVQRNDILLVDDPNIISDNAVELLRDKVFVIIHKKQMAKKAENSLPFVFVNAKNLKIEEDRYFGFVEKRQFETEKSRINWVRKIVDDYKREKEQLI